MSTPDDPTRNDHFQDETPHSPAVIELSDEATRESGPQSVRTVKKTIAILALGVSSLIVHTLEKHGPKTPRPPHVTEKKSNPGNGSDENCGRNPAYMYPDPQSIYGVDGKYVKESPAEPFECQFETREDGGQTVTGHEVVDGENTKVCFFTPIWSPDTAMRLAGTVHQHEQLPGVIDLEKGMIDIENGVAHNKPEMGQIREVRVAGEASLAVASEGRVSVTILPQKFDSDGKPTLSKVLISAQQGRAIVSQIGRDEDIIVEECQDLEIPVDIQQINGGCYIAQGEPGMGGFNTEGNTVILLAGTVLLALRRRKKEKEDKA
ncbi:hypothetical protein KC725_05710 [Candidatus Peregrinibacteria bacterium]|nr:hypothetical protein [Candidatus Peregrinibacteria bacterium]